MDDNESISRLDLAFTLHHCPEKIPALRGGAAPPPHIPLRLWGREKISREELVTISAHQRLVLIVATIFMEPDQ
jgi:hypothetical protein